MPNCQTGFFVGCTHHLVNILNKTRLSLLFDSQIVAVKSLFQLSETFHLGVVMAVECFSALFFVGHYMGLDFSKDTCSALLLFHVPSKQRLNGDVNNALVFNKVGSQEFDSSLTSKLIVCNAVAIRKGSQ